MKRLKQITVLTTACFVLAVTGTNAQSRKSNNVSGQTTPVKVGSVTLNLGAGVGSEYKGDYYHSPFGIKAAIEWGLWHAGPGAITLGAEVGTTFSNGGYYDDYRSATTIIAIRSAWHYGWKVRGLDTYGGFSAGPGFHHTEYKNTNKYDHNEVIPVFGAFIGASYFVTPGFGFNAEAGYDITNFQAGVIFKFK